MKLSITRDGYTITFNSKHHEISSQDMEYILPKLNNILSDFLGEISDNNKNKDKSSNKTNKQNVHEFVQPKPEVGKVKEEIKKESAPKERPLIRERIPNSNIIDIKDLDIKKAVTENALVRCPHCGQAHIIMVKSNDIMITMRKNEDKKEFEQIAEFNYASDDTWINMCYDENKTTKLEYYNTIQKTFAFKDQLDFTCDNNTEIFCPICKISDTFLNWKDAYESPLNFFETEYLCDVCGGEKLSKIVKHKKVYECDSCGHKTKYEPINGV